MYQAIDIETIRDRVMHGLAIPAGIIIQRGINGYAPELDTRLPFDADAAKELLAAAGYPDGFAVTLDCPNDRYTHDEAICRTLAAMLGEIGIRVTVAARPMREHLPMVKGRNTDFYMLGWSTGTYDSVDQFSYLIRSDAPYNATGYANHHVDDLIDAIETELITYGRDPMIEEVWRTVRDDIVYVPLHNQVVVWAMRDRLELSVDPQNWPRFRSRGVENPRLGASLGCRSQGRWLDHCLRSLTELFHLVQRGVLGASTGGVKCLLDRPEAPLEFLVGPAQRALAVDAEIAGEVRGRKHQVADLVLWALV
jgi:hypothetical protein